MLIIKQDVNHKTRGIVMKKRKIQIGICIFDVVIAAEQGVISADFSFSDKKIDEAPESEIKQASFLRQQIFYGEWDWLIEKEKTIQLDTHGIEVTVTEPIFNGFVMFGAGSISSQLKDVENDDNNDYNIACEAIESMILAHAVAGVNIESHAYLEGLETAIESIANNL